MKKLVPFVCLFVLLCGALPCRAEEGVCIFDSLGNPVYFQNAFPYIDENNRTMIPLPALQDLLAPTFQVAYEQDGSQVTIFLKDSKQPVTLRFTLGDYVFTKNDTPIQMDTPPVLKDGTVFLPLRFLGAALDYETRWISINGVDHIHFRRIYLPRRLFIWNEAETTRQPVIRYALLPDTDYANVLDTVRAAAVERFEELSAQLEVLPENTAIIITPLYRLSDHKVPREVVLSAEDELSKTYYYRTELDKICLDIALSFVPNADGESQRSDELSALGIKPIHNAQAEIYRFSYIGCFDEPFSVQVTVRQDGTAALHYARCDGLNDYYQGALVQQADVILSRAEVKELMELLDQTNFWSLPRNIDRSGYDGAVWFVEGVNAGNYHAVSRWCPVDGIYDLGSWFVRTANGYGLDLSNSYIWYERNAA